MRIMKFLFLTTILFIDCKSKNYKIDYCDIVNLIYEELKFENPNFQKPLILNKIDKINNLVVIEYLKKNSKIKEDFDLNNYLFNETTTFYKNENCSIIDFNQFKKINNIVDKTKFWKEYEFFFGKKDLIVFYKPIFSNDYKKILLYYEYIHFELGSIEKLQIFNIKDGKLKYEKTLLTSTF